jgi:hypothetical protein
VCPLNSYEKTYVLIEFYGSLGFTDWEILLYVRDTTLSPFWSSQSLSSLNTLQIQRVKNSHHFHFVHHFL